MSHSTESCAPAHRGDRPIPVISIVGQSGSGKTTLLERLLREMKQRGYRLAVIKHHRHRSLHFDTPGKDSYRFARAGIDHVVLAGPDRAVHIRSFDEEPPLKAHLSLIDGVDLIFTEGYKHADTCKIEISRGETGARLVSDPNTVIAIVSDQRRDVSVPQFGLDDIAGLADFIEADLLSEIRPSGRRSRPPTD